MENDKNRAESISSCKGNSTLVSHNISILGRRTSVRLEPEMWSALREISKKEQCNISDICSLVYLRKNKKTSLTAAIRVFMMLYYRSAATEAGHERAGHGNFRRMIERAQVTADVFPRYCNTDRDDKSSNIALQPSYRRHVYNDSGARQYSSGI